jgi:GrpB-like predicted nucleotidyltransferase (UPF0157 family)
MVDSATSGDRGALSASLRERLQAVGVDPSDLRDPADAWHRLRERFGRRVTLVERYALEAAHRGIRPDELDDETRERLGAETLRVQFPGIELVTGSERRDESIEVVPYDEHWPERFAEWRDRLAAALGPAAVRIEHVGSTGVPGLAAKPIIDIQVSVGDTEEEAAYVAAIEGCDLLLRSREPGHRYFRPPAHLPREVHVHVCDAGSAWERNHLLFRDYLRAHPAAGGAYAAVKHQLAGRYPADRLACTDAKSNFILDALEAARAWAARTGWPDESRG